MAVRPQIGKAGGQEYPVLRSIQTFLRQMTCIPQDEQAAVKTDVDAAMSVISGQVPRLNLNFRVPFVPAGCRCSLAWSGERAIERPWGKRAFRCGR